MRNTVVSIFLLIIAALTFQNLVAANSIKDPEILPSELTTLKPYYNDTETGRGKMDNEMQSGNSKHKKNNGLEKIYMIFMMCKTLVSTLLMFVSPVIQIKGFILSLIGTFINIARFLMLLNNSKNRGTTTTSIVSAPLHHYYEDGWHGEDRVGLNYNPSFKPSYLTHYPNFLHKYHLKS